MTGRGIALKRGESGLQSPPPRHASNVLDANSQHFSREVVACVGVAVDHVFGGLLKDLGLCVALRRESPHRSQLMMSAMASALAPSTSPVLGGTSFPTIASVLVTAVMAMGLSDPAGGKSKRKKWGLPRRPATFAPGEACSL
jgi:hypothetical protein